MKVVITGMGVMSSIGNGVDSLFTSLLESQCGIKYFPEWCKENGLLSFLGAPVEDYDIKNIPRSVRRTMSRMSEMGLLATQQAVQQAGIFENNNTNTEKTLVCMGTTTGSPISLKEYYRKYFERGGPEGQLSTSFFKVMNHSLAANVVAGLGKNLPIIGMSSACATSSQALVIGWEMIQAGLYDVVIAGGADELHETTAAIFDNVGAASRGYHDDPVHACRPFDSKRDGLVPAEGAGIVVLESESHAKKRGATILGQLSGGAYLCDGSHMSQPRAEAMKRVSELALERSGVSVLDIGYINAHATATKMGDVEESKSINAVFGKKVPVSSLKGHMGHSMSACGAIESIASIEMIKRGVLIPTKNLDIVDEECKIINAIEQINETPVKHVVNNNFAFGGMNVSLVLSAY